MAEYKVTINATPSKAKVISVSPKNVQNTITASPDTSLYFSNLSKKWATEMDGMVLNEDYSSKYYANVSAQNAQISQTNAQACEDTRVLLQGEFNQYSEELEEIATENTAELNTVAGKVQADTTTIVNKGKSELYTALNTLENNIEQSIKEIEGATLLDTKVDIDDMVLMDYVEAPFYQKSEVYTKTEADTRYVNVSGDTMTGDLTISTNATSELYLQGTNFDYTSTTAPSSATAIGRVVALDKNRKTTGCFQNIVDTAGSYIAQIYARRSIGGKEINGAMSVGVKTDGTIFTQAPTPETTDNSTKIATTAYVRTLLTNTTIGIPNYSAGVTVAYTTLTAGYTAPSKGILMMMFYPESRKEQKMSVNGVQLPYIVDGPQSDADNTNITIILNKGDVYKFGLNDTTTPRDFGAKFYPFKGV